MIFNAVFLLVFIASLSMSAPVPLNDQEEWSKFKEGFHKSYTNPEEEAERFQIFQNNLKNIKEHNEKFARGEVTYTQGVNQFADLTHEEFKSRFTGLRGRKPPQ